MRISTAELFRQGLGAITQGQVQVAGTQAQLAAGTRILRPSDDPSGAAAALRLEERINLTAQYQENIDFARANLAHEEGALARATEIAQRVRELAIAANDEALLAPDRQAIAAEVEQRLAELFDVANSRSPGGEYLFAGFASGAAPFTRDAAGAVTYAGDQGQRAVSIGTDHTVAVGDSGFAAFQSVRNGNGTFATRPAAGNAGSGVIDPGSVQDVQAYVRDDYTITLALDAGVTAGAVNLTDSGTNDALSYELSINGVVVDTIAEGGSRTLAALEAAIDAATPTTGVAADVDGGRLLLRATTPGTTITVTETLLGASEDTDTLVGYFGSNLTGLTTPSATFALDDAANVFLVTDSSAAVVASGDYAPGTDIEFNGVRTSVRGAPVHGDAFDITPSVNQSLFATLGNLASELALDGAALDNALNRALVDIDRGLDNLVRLRTEVGARFNTLDAQSASNADLTVELRQSLSNVRDLDYAAAAATLNQQLLALQAAQQSFLRVQDLSLFNVLR